MGALDGKRVFIAGASRGIGEAAARAMAAQGAAVALGARSEGSCADIAREIDQAGGRAMALALNVADPASVEAAVAQVLHAFGGVDAILNNAGVIHPIAPLLEADPTAWAEAIQINLVGAFHVMRYGVPAMDSNGRLINISSGAASHPLEGWSAYCAAKAGMAMLTQALAHEKGNGLKVFGFRPGVVDTEMQVKIRASGMNPVSQIPREQLSPPEHPAKVIAWLASGEGDDLSGQEFDIRDADLRRRVGLPATD